MNAERGAGLGRGYRCGLIAPVSPTGAWATNATAPKDALRKVESYQYDGNGNITKLTDRKGQVTTFAYDGLDRRTFVGFGTSGNTYSSTIDYTYDAGNRIRQIVDSRGGTITRDFDDLDRLTKEVTPNSPMGGISYIYDDASRRQSMTVGSLAPVAYAYNNADQLTGMTQGSRSAALTYDAAGRPRTVTLPDGIVETYGYDDASELTGITYTSGAVTLGDLSYGYDGSGRRVSVWGSFARIGLPAATASSATYNADNRLTKWNGTTLSYDANGNLTAFGTQTYTWNDRNQLGSTSGGAASFAYDGLGRRVSKTVSGTTTKYLYDGANVVQEQDSAGAPTANLLTGLGIDQVFSRTDSAGERSFLTDALGSTIALADTSGVIQISYTYEPFGAATSTGASSTNSFQFTGRENDGATGLLSYRARYHSPTFGRFISEDPLGFPGGPDVNVYAYVFNNPVGLVDPFGLDSGNGCGFLGFGCVVKFFKGAVADVAHVLYRGLVQVGRCIKFIFSCVEDIERILAVPVILGSGVGLGIVVIAEGCAVVALCPLAIGVGSVVIAVGVVIAVNYARALWRDRHSLFDFEGCEGQVVICDHDIGSNGGKTT